MFSVKGGRFITHMKKLRDVDTALANFFASGVLALGPKLGPILWQLPPQLPYDAERLTDFFSALPARRPRRRRARQPARRAGRRPRAASTTDVDRPLRHALEVRHDSYLDPAFPALAARARRRDRGRRHGRASGRCIEHVTADFCYVRLHGDQELYVSGYSDESLDRLGRARSPAGPSGATTPDGIGRDVYVYFDNDVKVRAPYDAMALADRLGSEPSRQPAR